MKAIIGLGNPGTTYKNNRHNVGFMAVDKFCENRDLVFEKKSRLNVSLAAFRQYGERLLLVKPHTYMNLSGYAVKKIVDYYKLNPEDYMIVYDDFQLLFGKIRVREKGSSGGHNGMESIIQETGIKCFNRLRIGIGTEIFNEAKLRSKDVIRSFVLSNFSRDEKSKLKEILLSTNRIMELFFEGNIKKAMNLFNTRNKNEDKESKKEV
ncbi:MAG: aminoacyl-tRNA hydrolase [Candidatus Aureabacteria bacterium]|nr:aminoacyl-tRNA hydrolase [Candidatus Auribacterota bacterium]